MTQQNDSTEVASLRTRPEIDTEYGQLAIMVGDLTAKIPHMEHALAVALDKMSKLLKEQAAPIANQAPELPVTDSLVDTY